MTKITPDVVMKAFNPRFYAALEHLEDHLRKEKVFVPERAGRDAANNHEKEIDSRVSTILAGRGLFGNVLGGYIWDNTELASIGVFNICVMSLAQYVKINKPSLLPPRRARVEPFIGVGVWVGNSTMPTDSIDKYQTLTFSGRGNSVHVNWLDEIDGYPVKYHIGDNVFKPTENFWEK